MPTQLHTHPYHITEVHPGTRVIGLFPISQDHDGLGSLDGLGTTPKAGSKKFFCMGKKSPIKSRIEGLRRGG